MNGTKPVWAISPFLIGAPVLRILPASKPMPARLLAYLPIISPAANIESKVSSAEILTQDENCLVLVPRPAAIGVAVDVSPLDSILYISATSDIRLFFSACMMTADAII